MTGSEPEITEERLADVIAAFYARVRLIPSSARFSTARSTIGMSICKPSPAFGRR
jgi:hypothetical protein